METENYLWKRVNRYLKFLRWVPFLRMVAVCNNLSFGKAHANSDIDLFVVAKKGRLFIVRSLLTLILHILGVRRHGKSVTGRFCLSFFIDDSRLNLEDVALEKDIYLAFWIKSLLPILDDGVSKTFLQQNLWAQYFFEHEKDFVLDYSRLINEASLFKRFFGKLLNGRFGDFFEYFLMGWQLKRARRKAEKFKTGSSFVIEKSMLKFHQLDRRPLYRDKWIKEFGEDAKITSERWSNLV